MEIGHYDGIVKQLYIYYQLQNNASIHATTLEYFGMFSLQLTIVFDHDN